jgi:hypothetical protein
MTGSRLHHPLTLALSRKRGEGILPLSPGRERAGVRRMLTIGCLVDRKL